jgi:Tol biopolymer transport system component
VDSAGAEGNFVSDFPSISDDGRYVAFASLASNLVTGDGNGQGDVFTHDRQTGLTTRVSVDSAGVEGNFGSSNPSISADGRHVAFESAATNLVAEDGNGAFDCFVHFLN